MVLQLIVQDMAIVVLLMFFQMHKNLLDHTQEKMLFMPVCVQILRNDEELFILNCISCH